MTELFDVPKRYTTEAAEAALLNIDPRLLQFSANWSPDYGAMLSGRSGCGKSLAAAMAFQRITLRAPRYWAAWVRADVLCRLFSSRDNFGDIARIKSARVLVLDDLGYERFSEGALEIIGERYDRDLPTIVTTGLQLKEFADRYSDATIRKVVEPGDGLAIDCWGAKPVTLKPHHVPTWVEPLQRQGEWDGRQPVLARDLGLPGF